MCQSFGWDQTHVDRDMHSVFPKLSIQLLCSRAIKIWGSIWQVFSFGATPNLVSKLQVARKTVHLCPWPGGLQPQLVLALQSLKAWNPNILTTASLTAIAMLLHVSVWKNGPKPSKNWGDCVGDSSTLPMPQRWHLTKSTGSGPQRSAAIEFQKHAYGDNIQSISLGTNFLRLWSFWCGQVTTTTTWSSSTSGHGWEGSSHSRAWSHTSAWTTKAILQKGMEFTDLTIWPQILFHYFSRCFRHSGIPQKTLTARRWPVHMKSFSGDFGCKGYNAFQAKPYPLSC